MNWNEEKEAAYLRNQDREEGMEELWIKMAWSEKNAVHEVVKV